MRGVSTDNFFITWTGNFQIEEDGTYTLFASADDSMTVYISLNSEPLFQLLNIDKNPSVKTNFAQSYLHKGDSVFMVVFYHEKDLDASASLLWRKDEGKFTPIEADWDGTVTWERTTRCFTTRDDNLFIIEFKKPDRTKPLVIKNMSKLNPYSRMVLLGTPNDLKWKQDKHGTLTIDFSKINQKLLDALEHAWVIEVCDYKSEQ